MMSQQFQQGQVASSARMVRRSDGREFPAADFSPTTQQIRKFLVVLSYFKDDLDAIEQLGELISQLERVRNVSADIMIYGRHDSPPFSENVRKSLEAKFGIVHVLRCRRRDATTYPFAANEMFYDLVTLFGQEPKWSHDYFAFINLEADCVPLRADWIKSLIDGYQIAAGKGASAIGHIRSNPIKHMNGVAIYAIDMLRRVQGNRLIGGNPNVAYDIDQAKNILMLCAGTPMIYFEYRIPTITPDDLFLPRKDGIVPTIFHGVKDDSARRAVKARLISFVDKGPIVRPNVFTFFQPIPDNNLPEHQSILKTWSDGWKSRGFNPIVLSGKEAVKNKHYVAFVAACEKLPAVVRKETQMNRFIRWLALDTVGGGLLTDYDVVPSQLTPEILGKLSGFHVARPRDIPVIVMAFVDKPSLSKWLDRIQNYTVQPDDTVDDRQNIVDSNVMKAFAIEDRIQPEEWVKNFGEVGWEKSPAVHFTAPAIAKTTERTQRKSFLMERFLRGDLTGGISAPMVGGEDNPVLAPGRTLSGPAGPITRPKVDLSDVVQELEDENRVLKERLKALEERIDKEAQGEPEAPAVVAPLASVVESDEAGNGIGSL